MNKYQVGEKVSLRLGGYNPTTVEAIVRKKFWFMYLVTWGEASSWDGLPPFIYSRPTRWKPSWRLLPY